MSFCYPLVLVARVELLDRAVPLVDLSVPLIGIRVRLLVLLARLVLLILLLRTKVGCAHLPPTVWKAKCSREFLELTMTLLHLLLMDIIPLTTLLTATILALGLREEWKLPTPRRRRPVPWDRYYTTTLTSMTEMTTTRQDDEFRGTTLFRSRE